MAGSEITQIISSLTPEGQGVVASLHETALALGYAAKISAMGKKGDDWKCEYVAAKPKRTLYILRVTGPRFSVRAKLFHIAQYADVLEGCTEHCKASLLAVSKDCGSHGGGCAGPVSFVISGTAYSKCRHYILFEDIAPQDVEGIRRLLQKEAEYSTDQ